MLSDTDILDLFEEGRGLHPVDRGLLLLARAHPEIPHDELVALTVGDRDAHLLRLRAGSFGDRLEGCAECPRCETRLELEASCQELLEGATPEPGSTHWQSGTTVLTLRAPDSRDLAAIATTQSVDEARALLLERCVTGDVELERLSETDRIALAAAIAAADPHAEKLLALSCPSCGHQWQILFDIVSYLWNEIATDARRVLREVDVLARAYGWSEAEILNLSVARRQLYLEMALS